MNHFRNLTPARQQLVKLAQRLNFGMIHNLRICDGQPEFGPALEVVEDVKLDGQRGPRPEHLLHDFTLKDQHIAFFDELDRIGSGIITELAIRHGLPCRMLVNHQGV